MELPFLPILFIFEVQEFPEKRKVVLAVELTSASSAAYYARSFYEALAYAADRAHRAARDVTRYCRRNRAGEAKHFRRAGRAPPCKNALERSAEHSTAPRQSSESPAATAAASPSRHSYTASFSRRAAS
jgi:hypothetical protein